MVLLWHNFATERFYVRVFLLGYLPATANEHYQSGFKVFHLVPNRRGDVYLQPV